MRNLHGDYIRSGLLVVLLLTLLVKSSDITGDYFSPDNILLNKTGDILYMADVTGQQVLAVDAATGKKVKNISLSGPPTGLALSEDNKLLFITCGNPDGELWAVNPESLEVEEKFKTGHTPNAPVLSSDGRYIYVCNRYESDISVIDLTTGKEKSRIPVIREPVSAVLDREGNYLFVANHIPSGPADVNYVASVLSVVNLEKEKTEHNILLPNGSNSLRGMKLSPDGKYIYIAHLLARFQLPTTQLERGWMNTNVISIIDVQNKAYFETIVLDNIDLGAANPWGIEISSDGRSLYLTHAGTNELSIIDRIEMHDKINAINNESDQLAGSANNIISNDLTFLHGLRKRVKLQGIGPRGIAASGSSLFIAEYFSESLGIVDLSKPDSPLATSIVLGGKMKSSDIRQGEMYFYDATRTFQQWQSCVSCHPGEARADALNWDLLNDGFGNPKNTKSLLYSHVTPPAMVTGIRADAETAVRAGMRFIEFSVRPEEEARAMDAYLSSLKPVPSPWLEEGKLSEKALSGKNIFKKAGCAYCHSGDYFTNMKKYNVGTGKGREKLTEFDTPTLVEIWRTAPYLYDGRAVSIREVITEYNENDAHGKTSKLSDQEISELEAYVMSL